MRHTTILLTATISLLLFTSVAYTLQNHHVASSANQRDGDPVPPSPKDGDPTPPHPSSVIGPLSEEGGGDGAPPDPT